MKRITKKQLLETLRSEHETAFNLAMSASNMCKSKRWFGIASALRIVEAAVMYGDKNMIHDMLMAERGLNND